MMKENWVYCRGDIYCAKLDPVVGSEQGGIRPVIVIQNDTGNKHAPTLIVATVTTRIHTLLFTTILHSKKRPLFSWNRFVPLIKAGLIIT